MVLGNQVEWALHVMVVLAMLPEDSRVSTRDMAEFHDVPKDYLGKAMQALARAGLVNTTLGHGGGYALAKPAAQISMLDVIDAVEGTQSTFTCTEIRQQGPCRAAKKEYSPVCEIAKTMWAADKAWRDILRKRKISEIASEVRRKGSSAVNTATSQWLSEHVVAPTSKE